MRLPLRLSVKISGLDSIEGIEIVKPIGVSEIPARATSELRVKVRAKAQDQVILKKIKVLYEDVTSKKYEVEVPQRIIKVFVPKPRLKLETITNTRVMVGEPFHIKFKIINIGQGNAYDVTLKLNLMEDFEILFGSLEMHIGLLRPGDIVEEDMARVRAAKKRKL